MAELISTERPGPDRLAIVVFAGGFDRVHYALVIASAAAATNRKVTLFFTGRAILALAGQGDDGTPGWSGLDPADDGAPAADRDRFLTSGGMAGLEELLEACVALGVTVMVCEMGLRALTPAVTLRTDVPTQAGGVVTFLNEAPKTGAILFI